MSKFINLGGSCLLIVAMLLFFQLVTVATGIEFRLFTDRITLSFSHKPYLGLIPSALATQKLRSEIRCALPKNPGDYFLRPTGADTTDLTDSERIEFEDLLEKIISPEYYDTTILKSVTGYDYSISEGSIHRREYYVAYVLGDTIYVISGWLGKFLSFYRAVPGDFRLTTAELQKEVQNLSPPYTLTSERNFRKINEERNYLQEYVDYENMTRIRNYLIYGTFIFPGKTKSENRSYNLIEITKFIDKEVMP